MNIESTSRTMISYRLEVIGMSLCYFDCRRRDNFIDMRTLTLVAQGNRTTYDATEIRIDVSSQKRMVVGDRYCMNLISNSLQIVDVEYKYPLLRSSEINIKPQR